ncbi:T9SS type A sorting domain-containing protein, partial [candidate division KSB1 bacterium]|nr:T9SS type A sorting domain-containing protein [candidate division KSB1 bacterium]
NGILFGFNKDIEATQANLYEVMVDIGDPIDVPEAPWEAYYVTEWGFSGGKLGGWDLTYGDFDGDVNIGGTAAPAGWVAVRGGIEPYVLSAEEDRALVVTGKIELVGGGFEDLASLRYGLFYSDSAGSVVQDPALDSAWVWNGTDEDHYGYLFVPPSGSNVATWNGTAGTWGAINNEAWWNIDGANSCALGELLQSPANAVAGPGIYDFAISISPNSTGNIVKTVLSKTDGSYYFEVGSAVPVVATTNMINSIAFAINNSTTTELNLIEIMVDRGPHIITDVNNEDIHQALPTVYSLKQNYPNPFNPTTTIEFSLPQNSEVKLVVYDLSGRVVAELAAGKFNAGYHNIHFDAADLASGVYLIRLKAGDYVDVKKAMLLK